VIKAGGGNDERSDVEVASREMMHRGILIQGRRRSASAVEHGRWSERGVARKVSRVWGKATLTPTPSHEMLRKSARELLHLYDYLKSPTTKPVYGTQARPGYSATRVPNKRQGSVVSPQSSSYFNIIHGRNGINLMSRIIALCSAHHTRTCRARGLPHRGVLPTCERHTHQLVPSTGKKSVAGSSR
jgi:hypothetical protein